MHIIYLTFDGLLEPIGQSQIVTPLIALSQRGYTFTIISLEKQQDLAGSCLGDLQSRLTSHGIRWRHHPFEFGSPHKNATRMLTAALLAQRRHRAAVLHARAHLPAGIAFAISRLTGTPYLFDMRGYWVDERVEEGNWQADSPVYRAAKSLESVLFDGAAHITCLTELACKDHRERGREATQVTTIADFERFVPRTTNRSHAQPLRVAYIGSLNASYATRESLDLARHILELRDDATFLALTKQRDTMLQAVVDAGLPTDRVTIRSVTHDRMHEMLEEIDWAILLLNSPFAKRGSMPTKLGELFAAGVGVALHGCNSEVEQWVRHVPTGVHVPSLKSNALRDAARLIADTQLPASDILETRRLSRGTFSLDAAVDAYSTIYDSIDAKTQANTRKARP